jgi:CubicO group peptidase (beta-lactamase class C family)
MKTKYFYVIFVLLFVFSCQTKKTVETVSPFSGLEQYLSSEVAEGRLKGVHALVFQNDEILFDQYYGYRDAELMDVMQGNELYFIQSMTKPIVSVALMILVEEGKVSLDDPIGKYLPEFSSPLIANNPQEGIKGGMNPAKRQPTIRELLSHTNGMSHGLAPTTLDTEILQAAIHPDVKTLQDRIQVLSELPLVYEPGTQWNYSFGTDLIAGVIEKVSGISMEEFLQERIFIPLGMSNTGYNLNADQEARVQVVYDFMADTTLQKAAAQPPTSGNKLFAGVNALFSSTHDYLIFARMLLGKGELNGVRILKPETVDLMVTDVTEGLLGRPTREEVIAEVSNGIILDNQYNFSLEPGYGFGLGFGVLQDSLKADRINVPNGEFFWAGANSTYFFINPKKNLIGIFMTQIGFLPNRNPFTYYFGSEMRKNTYQAIQ